MNPDPRGAPKVALDRWATWRRRLFALGPFAVGKVIGGAYRIKAHLASGGMGVVYEAEDLELNRLVAIKVALRPEHGQALRREAEVLASIRHPGVVAVHAFGRHEDREYLVMERVRERTLRKRIEEARVHDEPIPLAEVVDLLSAIADALSAVHAAGLAHRDLKAENVMLCGARVVLIDFGLFTPHYDQDEDALNAGTPDYVAPEIVLAGARPGEGSRADLYALGVLAFELLVGRTPFRADTARETLLGHISAPPPRVGALRDCIPRALDALVDELLAKEPEDRPEGAEAVLWRLHAIREEEASLSRQALHVLLVDDDDTFVRVLQGALRRALPGVRVDTMTDPRRALGVIGHVDLAVLDLNMPDLNGVELAMAIAGFPAWQRPVVVGMSGDARPSDVDVLRNLGVARFFPKGETLVGHLCAMVGEVRRRSLGRAR